MAIQRLSGPFLLLHTCRVFDSRDSGMDPGVRNLITSAVLTPDTIRYRRGAYVLDTKRLCESVEFRVGRLGFARANYSDPTIRKGVNGLSTAT